MTRKLLIAAAAGLFSLSAVTAASANTFRLDGFTSSVQTVRVTSSPVAGTPRYVGSSGFNITDVTDGKEGNSFVAWCLDIAHWLMPVGASQDYNETDDPFSNSYSLSEVAIERVGALFDANYGSLDKSNGDQAAAFQIALWEAAYEADDATLDMTSGLFSARSWGSTRLANTYLNNAMNYDGESKWDMSFFEVAGYDANRGSRTGQNLVTVSAVPLPAGALLLLTGLAGFGIARRRR